MAVAFTKEESFETASETLLPDRPISAHPNLVTEAGLKALELRFKEAREAYDGASTIDDVNERRRQTANPLRDLRYLAARLRTAQLVPDPTSIDTVAFGSTVSFRRDDGRMAALASTKNLLKANEALNRERTKNGGPDIRVDVVLHLGEVFYGNVGARGRLDFTVIGRAVNEASRLEKLCGTLEQHLLMSESFAATCAVACEYLGSFELRGVSKRADVFKLADAVS